MKDLPAHSDVPLDGDSQRHVDGGTEGDGRHGVQEVDVDLRQVASVSTAGNEGSRSFLNHEEGPYQAPKVLNNRHEFRMPAPLPKQK